MTWLGLGLPIQSPPALSGSNGGGTGALNSAPVIPNITLRFDIVAS